MNVKKNFSSLLATLSLTSFAFYGCNKDYEFVGLTAPVVVNPTGAVNGVSRIDNHSIQERPKMDAIFVMDNSSSMTPYINQVGQSMAQFISEFTAIDASVNYGVLTTMSYKAPFSPVSQYDPSNLLSPFKRFMDFHTVSRGSLLSRYAGQRWLNQDTPGLVQKFGGTLSSGQYINGNTNVGEFSNNPGVGAGLERADDSLLAGLEDAAITAGGVNHGFLRPDSRLAVVILTDEDHSCVRDGFADTHCSDSQIAQLSQVLKSRLDQLVQGGKTKGYKLNFIINSSVARPANRNVTGGVLAHPFTYLQMASDLNSPVLDIKSNFSPGLVQMGADLALSSQLSYPLAYHPINPSEMVVKVNSQILSTGEWSYDAASNSVIILDSIYHANRGLSLDIEYKSL